ncbi:N-acetyl-D-Glu racemase DgcA [Chthonobacter albigriseus]|uniref:N-acetyl-D-Glu racemase DgcA n=1 Tax=Chthonobacter albigriseus TaxID=1683161 RepID=UPI0015EF913B|nr:N-acetyl-D-Glu racemase DgcA [Chthonobacter albigriseus]
MLRRLTATVERWPIAGTFTIARGSKTEAVVVVATITDSSHTGRGECVPYARYGETVDGVLAAIDQVRPMIMAGASRQELLALMPAGAARNAIDCALIDLEAKASGMPAATLVGLAAPEPRITAFTLSLGTPDVMRAAAEAASDRPILKIKLGGGPEDIARLQAVRAGAPDAEIVVDANEGWTVETFPAAMEACAAAGVTLIEQPLPAGDDGWLEGKRFPVPLCADESAHLTPDVPRLARRYQAVNIKLDKTGGLTEALRMAKAADDAGLAVMVGCMVATSLAMAPAMLLAQTAKWVDLDGPLLLARDREPGLHYEGSTVYPPGAEVWG